MIFENDSPNAVLPLRTPIDNSKIAVFNFGCNQLDTFRQNRPEFRWKLRNPKSSLTGVQVLLQTSLNLADKLKIRFNSFGPRKINEHSMDTLPWYGDAACHNCSFTERCVDYGFRFPEDSHSIF